MYTSEYIEQVKHDGPGCQLLIMLYFILHSGVRLSRVFEGCVITRAVFMVKVIVTTLLRGFGAIYVAYIHAN